MFGGGIKGPLGSIERPASALHLRLGLAVFGVVAFVVATVLAVAVVGSAPLTVVCLAGCAASGINVYWIRQRIRYER